MRSAWAGVAAALAAAVATGWSGAASAQLAGSVEIDNDYRLRGYSLSAERPVAVLDLSYDHPSGFYLNGSAIGVWTRNDDAALLGLIGNAGYARRLNSRLTVDGGVTRLEYYDRSEDGDPYAPTRTSGYTEVYAGLATRGLSAHVFYSPDYFAHGVQTLYSEVDGGVEPLAKLRLSAHFGVIDYLHTPAGLSRSTQYDWRLGVARRVGPIDLHAAVSGGGPGPDYYDLEPHSKTALVVGASWSF